MVYEVYLNKAIKIYTKLIPKCVSFFDSLNSSSLYKLKPVFGEGYENKKGFGDKILFLFFFTLKMLTL